MRLRDITSVTIVKNEANYIGHVIAPLVSRLGGVIVFDTGSTDGTAEICEGLGATVVRKGESTPYQLGVYRTEMGIMADTPWTMVVDGDELYSTDMLDEIDNLPVPEGKTLGFTRMCSVDYIDGQYVLLKDMFNRVALHPKTVQYHGEYPFESPILFDDPNNFFYLPTENFAYHLHRLDRSPLDSSVFMRKDKQYLFALQNVTVPVDRPVTLPLDPKFDL